MHNPLWGRLSGHGWLCSCGNKVSLLSCFGGWVLDIWIVLNSYWSITLKTKDWSFHWYFLWECLQSKNSTKSIKHISNNFRTSACWRQPSWIWKESLATALLINIDFIMAGLAYIQHSASENCLQGLGEPRSGEFSPSFFSVINNTVRKMRYEAFLNSNFYWD